MPDPVTAWATILFASALTLATRLSGPFVMSFLPMSPGVERFLQNLSLSVLAALVASTMARGGLREAGAVAVAITVMAMTRKPVWAMGAGMVSAALWSVALG